MGLAVVLALAVGVSSTAFGHTGYRGLLHPGHHNVSKALTQLSGSLSDPVLRVDNGGTGPGLQVEVAPNKAPLVVGAGSGTATNLSADKLDGKDSSEYMGGRTYNHFSPIQTLGTNQALNMELVCAPGNEIMSGAYGFAIDQNTGVPEGDPRVSQSFVANNLDNAGIQGYVLTARNFSGTQASRVQLQALCVDNPPYVSESASRANAAEPGFAFGGDSVPTKRLSAR